MAGKTKTKYAIKCNNRFYTKPGLLTDDIKLATLFDYDHLAERNIEKHILEEFNNKKGLYFEVIKLLVY